MAQYYTLDEAAGKLGIKVDEFRKKLATEWKAVRRFPDGANLRFQAREIDELARSLGRASDPDLQIGEAPLKLAEEPGPAISNKKNGGKPAEQTVNACPAIGRSDSVSERSRAHHAARRRAV